MKKVLNSIFYFSIILIWIWLLRRPVFWIIGLEFSSSDDLFQYAYYWRFILPIAFVLTLSRDFLLYKTPKELVLAILGRLALAGLSVFLVYMSVFSYICDWSEKKVYLTSKHGSGKISLMEYGCGAHDSDPSTEQEIKKIVPMTELFNWVHSVDTTEVDLNEWIRVE